MISKPSPAGGGRGRGRRPGPPPTDGRQQHLNWLAMVEPTGPFLTLPVLRQVWPTLDALEPEARDKLRADHATWRTDPDGEATSLTWIWYVVRDLLDGVRPWRPIQPSWPGWPGWR